MRLFCPRKSEESEYFSEIREYSYILRHTHSQRLYTNSQTFGHPLHRFSTCMPTISEYFITCLCTILTHFWIFDVISMSHKYLQNLRKHLDTGSVNSTAFVMLWYASPNISVASGRASSLFPVSILPHQIGIFHLFFKILALTSDQLSSTAIPHLHSPK